MKKVSTNATGFLIFFAVCITAPLTAIVSSCAETKAVTTEVAKECLAPVSPEISDLVRVSSYETAEKDLTNVLQSLKDCVARLAAEETQRKLVAFKSENDAAPQSKSAEGSVTVEVALTRIETWLNAHGGPATPIKAGLPGGGHHCCYRPGFNSLPACGGIPITPNNINSLCGTCVPIQLWC